jgi:glycyl-tRNA synthetase (class II)
VNFKCSKIQNVPLVWPKTGKAFRNEIVARQFIACVNLNKWKCNFNIKKKLAHYANAADIEFTSSFGF